MWTCISYHAPRSPDSPCNDSPAPQEYPTLASGLQASFRRLPDIERLLPRAAQALHVLAACGAPPGAADAAVGSGSQEEWDEVGAEPSPAGRGAWALPAKRQQQQEAQAGGHQAAWRALLQQRQQADGGAAAGARQQGAFASLAPPPDPADGAWAADATRAAWGAARQLPGALAGLIEAVAVLRSHMAMLDLAAAKLPPVQRAVTAAAKVSAQVAAAAGLLEGAEWPAVDAADAGTGAAGLLSGLRLAPGADAACDAATAALADAEARLQQATQEALAMFGGAAPPAAAPGPRARGKQGSKLAAAPPGASVHSAVEGLLQVCCGVWTASRRQSSCS